MTGYATLSPTLAGGPVGWAVFLIGGTVLTVGTLLVVDQAMQSTKPQSQTKPVAVPQTRTETCTATGAQQNCQKSRYSVRVHAQGTDCGGTTGSTAPHPPAIVQTVPITSAQGIVQSNAAYAMLTKSQKKIRAIAKTKLETFIAKRPPAGYSGMKSFMATDPSGGKRYDVDSFNQNFIT